MTLYEIDQEILSCVDDETGEIFNADKFDALMMERDARVENLCLWVKNLKAEAEAIKAEKDNLAARQKAKENKMNSIKQFLTNYLETTSFETPKVKVSFRRSETLEVAEDAYIPEEFLKFKEPDIDKAGLKAALKEGLALRGCHIQTNYNIQIK